MQSGDRDPAQAGRYALERLRRQRHHRSALLQTQRTFRGFLGTSLYFGRGCCVTSPHKSELHPLPQGVPQQKGQSVRGLFFLSCLTAYIAVR